MIGKVTENMKCWFYWDAGYLKKCKELARIAESGQFICAATRQNMNRIISSDQWYQARSMNGIFSLHSSMRTEIFSSVENSNLGLNKINYEL